MSGSYSRQARTARPERAGGQDAPGIGFEAVIPNPKLKLLDQVREVMRLKHYSIRSSWTTRPFSGLSSSARLALGGRLYRASRALCGKETVKKR